jgi:hypothetical protein
MLVALREAAELVVQAAAGEGRPTWSGSHRRRWIGRRRCPAHPAARAPGGRSVPTGFALAEHVGAAAGLVVPLVFRGEAVGVLAAFDRAMAGPEFTAEDQRLVQAFAASAATAVMTAQNVAVQGLKRSVEGPSASVCARTARRDPAGAGGAAHRPLERAQQRRRNGAGAGRGGGRRAGFDRHRGLSNLITDMRPASSDELGAGATLEALIERTQRLTGLTITVDIDLAYEAGREAERHTGDIEVAMYRLVQEAITNAVSGALADADGPEALMVCLDREARAVVVHADRHHLVLGERHVDVGVCGVLS